MRPLRQRSREEEEEGEGEEEEERGGGAEGEVLRFYSVRAGRGGRQLTEQEEGGSAQGTRPLKETGSTDCCVKNMHLNGVLNI